MNRPLGRVSRASLLCALCFSLVGCGDDNAPDMMDAAIDGRMGPCAADAECDDGVFCNGAETCSAGACVAGTPPDCDDGMACTTDRCDEATARCVSTAPDNDGDGRTDIACGGDDCDDDDPTRFPGNTEVCDPDGVDEDCDLETFGFRDGDRDGFPDARCCNGERCGSDCDDTLPSAHPGEAESCDGFDNDCDGAVDEGVTRTYYTDADDDGFGDAAAATTAACFVPEMFSENDEDCDDTRPDVRPGAVEVCDPDAVDEDCDGVGNPESFCNCEVGESRTCLEGGLAGACGGGTQTCPDRGFGVCSIAPVPVTCNRVDDDCDGMTDESVSVFCWPDDDNDTFALAGTSSTSQCPDPARGSVGNCPRNFTNRAPVGVDMGVRQFECDDADPNVRPDALELCNGIDDDCDGGIDEGRLTTCYLDGDGDSYPPSGATPMNRCPDSGTGSCPAGFTSRAPMGLEIDCDDDNVGRSPAVAEACNGVDDDCDSATDEGITRRCYTDRDEDGYAEMGARFTTECGDCPAGTTVRTPSGANVDCDDRDGGRSPAVPELCDGRDQDCDRNIDEGTRAMLFPDADFDGYGEAGSSRISVCPGPGYSDEDRDCNDGDARVYPDSPIFHPSPVCPVGWTPCTLSFDTTGLCEPFGTPDETVETMVSCRDPGTGVCEDRASVVLTFWDYDCSGALEPSLEAATCSRPTCGTCGGSCGTLSTTTGYVHPAQNYSGIFGSPALSTPACGMVVGRARSCACVDINPGIGVTERCQVGADFRDAPTLGCR